MRVLLQIVLSILFLLTFTSVHAQQRFGWVTGGGTIQDDPNLENNPEGIKFMCTDPNGNVYALSIVGNDPIHADTFYLSQGAYGSDQNILITSYACNGQMRWAKLIASSNGECIPYGIVADSLGHVYVAGYFSNATLHIGYDTSITGLQYEYNGVIQFDTSGHFNWIRYVGDNSLNNAYGTFSQGSVVVLDGVNNVHFLNYMKPGVNIMTGLVSQYGDYDLTYNSAGILLNAVRLGMDSVYFLHGATIDPVSNKLYVCGERNQVLNPTDLFFAAAFDANRNLVWMDTLQNQYSAIASIVYDRMGHLYFNGAGNYASFSFNGISNVSGASSVIMKTDTNGHPMLLQSYYCNTAINGYAPNTLTLLPNNLIASAGGFAGKLTNGTDSIVTPSGEGQNPFLTILDTSGVPMSLLQIHGDGFYDAATSITSDKVGNIYIGGQVADSIYAGNITPYVSVGGNTDFFIMKYGVDCECTSMPVANYTDTGTHSVRGFTYTGIPPIGGSIDSVVWNFGDGSATVNSMSSVTHTYDSGIYEACVYAYSTCGSDMHCSRVQVTVPESVTTIENLGISVYPNPATDEVNITTQSAGITYRLMSITGLSLQSGSLQQGNNNISLNGFASGMYILEMKNSNEQMKVVKVVKE